nr:NepR family anti-sigma factor [Rhizobium paknamense]
MKDAGDEAPGHAQSGTHHTISAKLKHFYNTVQEEGIPDRFVELLERLEAAEKQAGTGSAIKDKAR